MGNFSGGSRFGGGGGKKFGGRSFGGDRGGSRGGFSGGRDGGRPPMHKAKCGSCGSDCEVPFRPTGERPVLCGDCFKGKGDDRGGRDFSRKDSRPSFGDRKPYQSDSPRSTENYKAQFEQVNAKLDLILKTLGLEGETTPSKSVKYQKAPKKEIDTEGLKGVITTAVDDTKTKTKKKVVKKKVTGKKKASTKKKK